MNEELDDADSVLLDVNAVAIGLTENHPAHEYIYPALEAGISGEFSLIVFDYLPFRAQYIMVTRFRVDRVDARNSIQSFLRNPVRIVSASKQTLLASYKISAEKDHDVYDCFFVALAREHGADAVLTTDSDFELLCDDEDFSYVNPVPESLLGKLSKVPG